MSDKKNEDFTLSLPGSPRGSEKGAFLSRSPSRKSSYNGSSSPGGSMQPLNRLDNSPIISVLAYCLASISMTIVNKYVVSGKGWNLSFFYLFIQAVVSTVTITACKHLGVMKALAPFDQDRAKKWFPVSILLVSMIYTGNKALQFLSVPVYTIFKNLTIIVIAYGEVLWFGGSVTPLSLLSFGLMVLSSVVAAWADIQSAVSGDMALGDSAAAMSTLSAGYAWMGLNVFCSAAYLLSMRKVIKKMNFKDWDSMYYNNLLTIPVLLVGGLVSEDWSSANLARSFPPELRGKMITGMIYSGLGAIFISYCSAWCIRVTSPTTYSMVGALNKLPIAISGLIFFAAPVTVGSVSAIIIGFISGTVYALAKVKQQNESKGPSLPMSRGPMSASAQSNRDANS